MSDITQSPGPGRTAAVIPAAGRGVRLGPGAPKALRQLGGVPILVHAVRAMARARAVSLVVVAAPPADVHRVQTMLDEQSPLPMADLLVVAGGDSRQESVWRGLQALPGDVVAVLVHDAARPLVPVETVDAVIAAVLAGSPAVVPALPVSDTIKRIAGTRPDGGPEPVADTLDRAMLRAVQTPQGFDRATLEAAHRAAGTTQEPETPGEGATDDAGMVERMGVPVVLVPGHEEAFKVTRPLDLVLAEAVIARRRKTDDF